MTRRLERLALGFLLWMFSKTECHCPDCTRHREQFERRRA